MYDDWTPERPPEEFGDALVIGGVVGLVAGFVLHNPFMGVMCGLMLGAVGDGIAVVHASRVAARR